ncbi:hypothetical protein KVR01_008032 [Diaporthe batatas]|uniref:uncharacterized protein n=1 Tax=Diaporthe batatas TaxID=748121 RepID=UPI001D04751F|nr:uncharacterized protein KVR01_008032 [Diaporthe batatas]KAG8162267.1 hypothetical protein KVR01_008032 [Diaporthe batatas]
MKVPRENIKPTGLSVVYDPEGRTDVSLDIILVHGLGGHPVRTWLHTPASEAPANKEVAASNITSSAGNQSSWDNEPVRALSLKHLASPNQKKGNTLKKPPRGGDAASPRLRVFGSPLRPRSEDLSDGSGGGGVLSPDNVTVTTRSGRAPRRGSHRRPRAQALRQQSPLKQSEPALDRWGTAAAAAAVGDERDADEACDLGTFWPTDLLPDLCCDARILTWGFRTRISDGHLVPGQLDVFSRGRELHDAVNDLLASCREHGQSRELVFVAHSTGGIIIKEVGWGPWDQREAASSGLMLRLASSYEDTRDRPLLASIAGIVFLGCPMRDSPSGSMIDAMTSMAAATIGVEMHDRVLQELLGWDASLAYEGRDALEQARREYGFQVKTYRETIIIPPADNSYVPWVALAVRRDSQSLEGAREEAEYIESDHLNMCRFASAGNDGYRSLASFILRLAQHQSLRHRLTPEEEANLQLLAAAGAGSTSQPGAPFPTQTMVLPEMPTRKAPPWLLKHPAFGSWYHRRHPQDCHRLLWLRGPAACGKTELLSSLASHVAAEWSPTAHSSALITAVAEGEPLLQGIIPGSERSANHNRHSHHKTCDKKGQQQTIIASTDKPGHIIISNSTTTTTSTTGGPTHETASPLRAILQQLWAHDPRLRNLVGGLAKASSLRARAADSCDDHHARPSQPTTSSNQQPRTQGDAGGAHAAPQPQTPKVYSRRRPKSSRGDGTINNDDAQGPPTPRRVMHEAGGNQQLAGKGRLVRGGTNDSSAVADQDQPPGGLVRRRDEPRDEEKEGQGVPQPLDDARIVSFFLQDYLRLRLPQNSGAQASTSSLSTNKHSRAAPGAKPKAEKEGGRGGGGGGDKGGSSGSKKQNGNNTTDNSAVVVETPGTRRIFVFVDIAPTTAPSTARDLIWCLAQLARRSTTLSICVASQALGPEDDGGGDDNTTIMAIQHLDGYGGNETRGGPRLAAAASSVASTAHDGFNQGRRDDDVEDGTLPPLTVDVPTSNAEDVASYIEATLLPDIEDREALAAKLARRSRGVMFWVEHAVAIVNDASEDGVSGEVVCSMLDDIAPEVGGGGGGGGGVVVGSGQTPASGRGRSGSSSAMLAQDHHHHHHPGQARLDDLYAWKLRRLGAGEARAALVLMQWVMLAPEALRLNELLVAIRLTMLVWPQDGGDAFLTGAELTARALDVEPPMSLRDLRRRPSGDYVPADNPSQFWRWARRISQGLVRLDGGGSRSKVSSEPLGLQRVVPAHESVRRFFLEGRGFQILTPAPPSSSPSPPPRQPGKTTKQQHHQQPQQQQQPPPPPTTEQLIDTSYYALLHTCLAYLNMTDFDSLSRTSTASQSHHNNPRGLSTPDGPLSEAEEESTRLHRSNAEAQRALVTSSYPLLRYTVDNLIFHLLRPRALRYFPPQAALLRLLTADGCRIWRRWTRLLGIPDASGSSGGAGIITTGTGAGAALVDVPTAVLSKARARPATAVLLRPVYGASFRLDRVFRRAHKTSREQAALAAQARARRPSRLRTQRSGRSFRSAAGGGAGGGDASVRAGAGAGAGEMPPTPRTPTRPAMVRSASESSVVFALVGGGDGDDPKAHWLVPKSPRSPRLRSDSLGSIMSNPASPGMLFGIQEV